MFETIGRTSHARTLWPFEIPSHCEQILESHSPVRLSSRVACIAGISWSSAIICLAVLGVFSSMPGNLKGLTNFMQMVAVVLPTEKR
jgi:hypothetical protein